MRFFKKVAIAVFFLIIVSCQKNEVIHFYSEDKSQCVTVINDGYYRFIMNGKHFTVPVNNYIKLNIKDIDEISDVLYICWKNQIHQWEIVSNNAKVIENHLDNTKYSFSTDLPIDERGIPTESKFASKNCAIFYFYLNKLTPDKGAIVETVK